MLQTVQADSAPVHPFVANIPEQPETGGLTENTAVESEGLPRKGPACSVCSHPQRKQIDASLFKRTKTFRQLGLAFGINHTILHKHATKHMRRDVAAPAAEAGPAAIEIAIKRRRLEAMDLRWSTLTKQLKKSENTKLPVATLLRELRELEASTAKELGETGTKAGHAMQGTQVLIIQPPAIQAPPIHTAAIISRAGLENDKAHYHSQSYGESLSVATSTDEPATLLAAAPGAAAVDPPGPSFPEGDPLTHPKSHILITHPTDISRGILSTHDSVFPKGGETDKGVRSSSERRQVWLKCGDGHEWGSPEVGGVAEYGFCGRCGQRGE